MIITPHFLHKVFFLLLDNSAKKFRYLIILCDRLVLSSVSGIWIKHKQVYTVTDKIRHDKFLTV